MSASLKITRRYGQYKRAGIPSINWDHPLAQGLLFYVYDAGGYYLDLVQHQSGKLEANTTVASVGSYPLGYGVKWPGANNSSDIFFPVSNGAKSLGATIPWSTACGTYYLGSPSGVFVAATGVSNALGDTGPCFLTNIVNNTVMSMAPNNGATIPNFVQTISLNTFQTWAASTNSATVLNMYVNGKLDSSPTLASTTFSIATASPYVVLDNGVTSAIGGNSNGPGGISGYLPYYAAWARALTAADNFQLHNDPYCFLIYPEDDIFPALSAPSGTTLIEGKIPRLLSPTRVTRGLLPVRGYPLAPSNTASLFGQSGFQTQSFVSFSGKVPLLGFLENQTKVLDQPLGKVPVSGYSEAQVKALVQPSGKVPIVAAAETQVKALAQPSGKVGLTAFTEAMVKSLAVASLVTAGAQALVALSALMVKASAQPSGKVGITGATEAQVKVLSSIRGSTPLSARAESLVKALANTPILRAALAATGTTQVKEQASPAGRLTLTASSTTQFKSNALATTTSNFLALVGTLTAQTKSALGNPPTIQILSSGRWISPEEVISSIARKYGRLGGLASANSRTAAQRSLLASIAAAHRWQK